MMKPAVIYPQRDTLLANINAREGEFKVGQVVTFADQFTDLNLTPCRFALIGIPEDIGPRANLGRGGAGDAWQAFLTCFLNLQSNSLMPADDVLILGTVACQDLMDAAENVTDLEKLRALCAELDDRVTGLVEAVVAAELIPIVIGGGHNNAFGVVRACSKVREMPLAVANLDPHSDFRALEGRHSGNPFHYAYAQQYLSKYAVVGLHEQKNNQSSLDSLKSLGMLWYSIQQTHWQNTHNYDQCLEQVAKYLLESGLPIGVELDLDAISDMPSSAMTTAGVPLKDAIYYVDQMGILPHVQYLHIAEGAPMLHANGLDEGKRIVGQSIAELVSIFIKAMRRSD